VGEAGEWPGLPAHWSFSTLQEVESCPLRYALRSATYSEGHLGGTLGYPDKTSEAALLGIVMHAAVEQVVRALRGGPAASDPSAAVSALRELGGYPAIIERGIASVETQLSSNPRMSGRASRLGASLRRRAPEIRSAVQRIVARLPPSEANPGPVSRATIAPRPRRGQLALGPHPEARLRSDDKRFKGQVDLLTVNESDAEIVDFKSGRPDDHHAEQVTLYGLLWMLDDVANPNALPVGKMTVAYSGSEVDVALPASWSEVEADLVRRIEAADESVSGTPSPRPGEGCSMCSVRHMCEAYWNSDHVAMNVGSFGDAEVRIASRHGAMSWRAQFTRTGGEALVRTTSEDIVFHEWATLRLLDVVCERQDTEDGSSSVAVLTAVASSEMFEVVDP
jgi:hypothetical protein